LTIGTIWLGVYPQPILKAFEASRELVVLRSTR